MGQVICYQSRYLVWLHNPTPPPSQGKGKKKNPDPQGRLEWYLGKVPRQGIMVCTGTHLTYY